MSTEKRIIEIGGVKMEVDLRQAKAIDAYRVGDKVKVLVKDYSNSWRSHPGVIIGFDNFVNQPAISLCYVKQGYSDEGQLCFVSLTADTKEIEICPANGDELPLQKDTIVDRLDRGITKAESALEEARAKKEFFLRHYNKNLSD